MKMDTLYRAISTYGMSALLLLTLLLAMRGKHSPATSRWFRAQFYGTITVEMAEHIIGWDSFLYTCIYIPYTLVMLVCSGLIVCEAYRESS
jgi:hypothetical protein